MITFLLDILGTPSPYQDHGWGLHILRQTAGEYGGDMPIRQEDGMVTVVLWLNAE